MTRALIRILLDVGLTIVLALVLLTLRFWVATGSAGEGFAEGARELFLFMDIGLGVWLVALVAIAMRGRSRGRYAGVGVTLALAALGVVLNALTVLVVGLVQQGGPPTEFLGFALTAGICTLLAAAPAVTLVHRAVPVAGRDTPAPRTGVRTRGQPSG